MPRKIIFLTSLLILIGALIFKISSSFSRLKNQKNDEINRIKVLGLDEPISQKSGYSIKVTTANIVAELEAVPISPSQEENFQASPTQFSEDFQNPSPSISNSELQISDFPSPSPTAPPMRIKSIRILGELENNGTKIVEDVTPIISLFDATGQKIADKVADFSDGYFFPILNPGEKYFYDVQLKTLPSDFQNLTITFKPSSKKTQNTLSISKNLKIEDRDIEELTATSSAGQNFHYWRLRGKMINTGNKPIKNSRAIAIVKDQGGRVFSWGSQDFPSDLFSKNQKIDVNILLTPIKEGEAEDFNVYLFGEEL